MHYLTHDFALVNSNLNVINFCTFEKSSGTVCCIKTHRHQNGRQGIYRKAMLQTNDSTIACDESTMARKHCDHLDSSTKISNSGSSWPCSNSIGISSRKDEHINERMASAEYATMSTAARNQTDLISSTFTIQKTNP